MQVTRLFTSGTSLRVNALGSSLFSWLQQRTLLLDATMYVAIHSFTSPSSSRRKTGMQTVLNGAFFIRQKGKFLGH